MARITHYASLVVGTEEIFGTAELIAGGYLFRREGERRATLVRYRDPNLVLNGLVALSEMQRELDDLLGGPAAIACSREEGRQ